MDLVVRFALDAWNQSMTILGEHLDGVHSDGWWSLWIGHVHLTKGNKTAPDDRRDGFTKKGSQRTISELDE